MSSSEDDVPLSSLKKSASSRRPSRRSSSRSSTTPTTSYKEASDDDEEFEFDENAEEPMEEDEYDEEDEDDIPLSKLVKKASPKAKKAKAAPKSKAKTKAKAKPKAKAKAKPKKKKVVKKPVKKSSSAIVSCSSELYAKAQKGKLISELLCRWWYAIKWPEPGSLPSETPPNSDAMDGFPGVYVVTSGADIGKILDFRNKDTCPNFINMSKKSSEELQELLIKAIKEQQRVLIESEGEGTQLEKDLKQLLKWAEKLKPKASDTEAKKVLKAAGLLKEE